MSRVGTEPEGGFCGKGRGIIWGGGKWGSLVSSTSSSASILSAPSVSCASLAFLAVTRGDGDRGGIAVKIMGQCGDGESDGEKDGGSWLSLIFKKTLVK